ncbi:hypothetical protein BCR32DRAFT_286467 [Anaeromyces robustus]|uniref:Reverse transcriptase zinc-binding domain-containing protein n=1 Tax=Anaeromyces robustus TaxID=1754192 RepID=A0A1Y1VRQ3_9FUNG|nr:hypothetical protein BCR32DRAFT_298263 [Anaeromyces robustus]ORX65566.1 hypothetical protein BCR32DRAFT_286467 [Anaeromyces robustus]|eukprot:ORX63947.1 hypothetical protein BCR32DRAFT_298263 [Anaeromyces robustus]
MGIDWRSHLEMSARKSLRILNSLQYYKNIWPSYIKLHIFRIYIRPIMEHSACLAFYWMNNKTTDKLKKQYSQISSIDYNEIKSYHEVTKQGMEWIVNSNKTSISSCLLGLPTSLTRLYCLALKLQRHMAKMDVNNPLYIAFNTPYNGITFSCMSLTYKFFKWKELFTSFKYFGPTIADKLSSYNKHIENVDKIVTNVIHNEISKQKMGNCILPFSRVAKIKISQLSSNSKVISTDQCIFIRNNDIRNYAIAWRLNSLFLRKKCSICGKEFNRSHINNCNFINKQPFNRIIKKQDIYNFKNDKIKYKNTLPKTYNILDSLLNHQNYYIFGKFIKEMKEDFENIE